MLDFNMHAKGIVPINQANPNFTQIDDYLDTLVMEAYSVLKDTVTIEQLIELSDRVASISRQDKQYLLQSVQPSALVDQLSVALYQSEILMMLGSGVSPDNVAKLIFQLKVLYEDSYLYKREASE